MPHFSRHMTTSNILYIVLIYLSAFSTGRHQCRSILSTCGVKKQSDLKGSDVFVQGKTDDLKTDTCSHHWLKLSLQIRNLFLLDLKQAGFVGTEPQREPMASHDLMFSWSEGGLGVCQQTQQM